MSRLDCVRVPITSSRGEEEVMGWVRVMVRMEVWRPSLVSRTVKRAGPVWVRRRKSRWRAMVSGWFWEERVREQWREATRRKTLVMKPPWGTSLDCVSENEEGCVGWSIRCRWLFISRDFRTTLPCR